MDLKEQINIHLVDNEFQAALERLKQEELSENQKNDLIFLEQKLNRTKRESQVG